MPCLSAQPVLLFLLKFLTCTKINGTLALTPNSSPFHSKRIGEEDWVWGTTPSSAPGFSLTGS